MNATLRAEAADPQTTPERLRELAKQRCAREVAGNPNTPTDLLLKLAARHFEAFLANPVLPLLLLEDPGFCGRIPAPALRRLLRRDELPETFLQTLQRHPDREVSDSARLHRRLASEEPVNLEGEAFGVLCAAPANHGLLATLLRLRLVPLWMIEALAGSANAAVRTLVIGVLEKDASPDAAAVFTLYKRAGIYPPSPTHPASGMSPSMKPEELTRLAAGGPWARQRAAEHEDTPPAVLKRLAADPVRTVRLAALRNRSTPPEPLWMAVGSADERVRLAILANPCAPEVLIEQLAGDRSSRVRAAALRHRLVNANALDRLAADPDVNVRLTVARHRATAPATLGRLAHDASVDVRERVATRPHLPPEEVERLLGDGARVRQAIAQRRDLTEDQLIRLLCDEDRWVRTKASWSLPRRQAWRLGHLIPVRDEISARLREIGYRPRPRKPWQPPTPVPPRDWWPRTRRWCHRPTPEDYDLMHLAWEQGLPREDYERFATHPEPQVRETAANSRGTPQDILHRLAADPVQKVRERLALNDRILPETCEVLSRDAAERVRSFTAHNRNCPPQILAGLAHDPCMPVRRAVIQNPSTPEQVVRRLATDPEPDVRAHLRHNPKAPGDLLGELFAQPDADRELLLQHANIPRPLLDAALDGSRLLQRCAAACNPNLTPADLTRLAAEPDVTLRALAAKHRALPPEAAAQLAASAEPSIRQALAESQHTPPDVLMRLVEDPALRSVLPHNKSLPPEALLRLAQHPDPAVARSLVYHHHLPPEAVRLIATKLRDNDSEWFGLFANPALTPELVHELHGKVTPAVRQTLAHAAAGSAALQVALIQNGDREVRAGLSYSRSLSTEAMLLLANDPDRDIQVTLCAHPRLTVEAMRPLLAHAYERKDPFVRSRIAFHQNAPHELRLEIARAELAQYQAPDQPSHSHSRARYTRSRRNRYFAFDSAGILLGLLKRPEMPVALFEPLLDHPDPAIHHAFLDRPDLPPEWRLRLREQTLASCRRKSTLLGRLCLLSLEDCPASALQQAASHGRWIERFAVARNPATPRPVLDALAHDANRVVQQAAAARLTSAGA